MDFLGFLLAAATVAVVAIQFRPVVDAARRQLVANVERIGTWVTYALAAVAKRLLIVYATVFFFASIVVIHTVGNFNNILSGWARVTLFLTVMTSIVWMVVTIVRLWPVDYASLTEVQSVGTNGGLTVAQFRMRHGRRPQNPLATALTPIFCSSLAFAATCIWIKFEAAGVVESRLLLPVRMASDIILPLGLALSIAAPVTIGYYVAKVIDPFSDAIVISVLRVVAIAAPGITGNSFDRLTEGGTKLNVPLEKLFPAVMATISPPIAILLTLHGFAMWVGDGFVTAYLTALLSVGGMAGFCLWAFGMPSGDWPKKVVHALWVLIIGAVIFRFFVDVGAVHVATSTVEAHRGWLEVQWISLRESFTTNVALGHQGFSGFVRGIVRATLALVLGPVLFGALAGGFLDMKGPGRFIGTPAGFACLGVAIFGFAQMIAVFYGWYLACA